MNEVAAEHAEYDEHDERFARLIAKCWADKAFKAKLLANTAETLKEEGFGMAEGVTVKVVENTEREIYMVVPNKPEELSDEELNDVVGGGSFVRRGIRAINKAGRDLFGSAAVSDRAANRWAEERAADQEYDRARGKMGAATRERQAFYDSL
ncbi:NHLP leader peptide family RiPP precursor [Candidatus Methylospira mobilis]|uniref:NHLP leader peptide family RiPP precursor n=1 Tax=Candidatus Methylospira mobilis TaxID=1808979 RepID=UPI0028E1D850|nr:NHLP leader peptide family RiPP precursor [Candidatus Methylospira mobilis]WNV03558.1 NHLP leader peptide family RiPP precursor [Candidatus Methylospira mobilis]